MIGSFLERAGWRQGSVVSLNDQERLLNSAGFAGDTANACLLVASHSCDIANNNIELDPDIELSIGTEIEVADGNCTFNKNPRTLHTKLLVNSHSAGIFEQNIELLAPAKLKITKEELSQLTPDPNRSLVMPDLTAYINWLAARYSRPSLPTHFNDCLHSSQNKLRRIAKKANDFTGLYVAIEPDRDLEQGELYHVDLLGMLPGGYSGNRAAAEKLTKAYGAIMEEAGMNVVVAVRAEDEMSVAAIRRFKRFYFDDLSFKDGSIQPVEVATIT